MQQFQFPHTEKHDDGQYLQKCVIVPDPGRYNGSFSQVSCTVNMTDEPLPSINPPLPNNSDENLQIIAAIMDDMEKWGVLVKPEQLGVVPTHVHPCILVP